MGYLNKEESLFLRAEDGTLLPVNVELELLQGKPKIQILPITSGKFNELSTLSSIEQDNRVILEHCLIPKFEQEDINKMKPFIKSAILNGIISVSLGKNQLELNNVNKEDIIKQEQKNLGQTI